MYNFYYFIDKFNISELEDLNTNIKIIYRNYNDKNPELVIKTLNEFCKKTNRNLFLSNNLKLALKYKISGLYIPSFNKTCKFKNINKHKNFKLIGSAHNVAELKIKEIQGCQEIFLSPIFFNSKNKNFLDIIKFNLLANHTKKKIVALGGINKSNFKKLKLTKSIGIGGISFFK